MLYAESETRARVANGRRIRLEEQTHYPFDERVQLTVHLEEVEASGSPIRAEVAFPLYLRIPSWAEGASVSINGKKAVQVEAGKYALVQRTWKEGDRLVLTLPMHMTTRLWTTNQSSVSVDYGPLTLSLRIGERYHKRDSRDREIVQDDSHWQETADASLWPAWEIFANTPWNYALVVDKHNRPVDFKVTRRPWPADDFPFTLDAVPLTFTALGRQVPSWGYDATGMTALLPTPFDARAPQVTPLTLVPMGAARLRIAAFPREIQCKIP